MNLFFGQLSRSAALRRAPLALRRPIDAHIRPVLLSNKHLLVRGAASSVSGRPGSQTLGHAATNVKEEVGNSAADLAKRIAGGNMTQDAVSPTQKTFLGITNAVATEVPKPYMIFGLAGGLPYLGASATTVYLAHQAGLAATGVITNIDPGVAHTILDQALTFQVTYGAVMLSFLGALHWGMEFAGLGGHKGYARLTLGAVPVLYAWPTLVLDPMTALIAQWVGFTGLWYADSRATTAGWTPKWYSQYRFYLSILVGTCIIGSLAGTSYWGPVAGHGLLSHDLAMVREQRQRAQPERTGVVGGDIETTVAPEDSDNYVVIKRKEAEKEGENKDANPNENQEEAADFAKKRQTETGASKKADFKEGSDSGEGSADGRKGIKEKQIAK